MALRITTTPAGLHTYEVDGAPCRVEWEHREDCKAAAVAFQNIIAALNKPVSKIDAQEVTSNDVHAE